LTTGVGYIGGANIVIVNIEQEIVHEVTPEDAVEAAERCVAAAEAGRDDFTIMIPTADGDAFTYAGDPACFRAMANDLRIAAEKANARRP
jgi:hypothetical protein